MIEQAPGITRLLDRLEGKKFVRRDALPITAAGSLLHHQAWARSLARTRHPVRKQDNQVLHRLNESEIEDLIRLLETRARRTAFDDVVTNKSKKFVSKPGQVASH